MIRTAGEARRVPPPRAWLLVVLSCIVPWALPGCDDGGPTGPLSSRSFQDLALGRNHTCALDLDGGILCWGANFSGQLGVGHVGPPRTTPVRVPGPGSHTRVVAGAFHACALGADARARCWGLNASGQVGDGSTEGRSIPTEVDGDHEFVALGAGWQHSCGLAPDGSAWCWGANHLGQLGDGTRTDRDRPVPVAGDRVFATLSVGGHHACGVDLDGAAWCWGWNGSGQLGDGTVDDGLVPVPVEGLPPVTEAAAGFSHTCARVASGQMRCWGSNWWGEVGIGVQGPHEPVPSPVARDFAYLQASLGMEYTCAVGQGGPVFCWGRGMDGQLGDQRLITWPFPYDVISVDGAVFRRVETGLGTHTCALTTRDAVYCWGRGEAGELGNTHTTFSPTPVRVEAP